MPTTDGSPDDFPLPAAKVKPWSAHLIFRVYAGPTKTREWNKFMKRVIEVLKARGVEFVDTCRSIPHDQQDLVWVSLYRTVPQSPFIPAGWQPWSYDRLRIELITAEAEMVTFKNNSVAFPPCKFPITPTWKTFFFTNSRLGEHRDAILRSWGQADTVMPHVNPATKGTVAYKLVMADLKGGRAKTEGQREARRDAAAVLRTIGARNRSVTPDFREDVTMHTAKTPMSEQPDIAMGSQSSGTVRAESEHGEDLVEGDMREVVPEHQAPEAGPSGDNNPAVQEDPAEDQVVGVQVAEEEWEDVEDEAEEVVKGDKKGKRRMKGKRRRMVQGKDASPVRAREATPPVTPKQVTPPGSPIKVSGKKRSRAMMKK